MIAVTLELSSLMRALNRDSWAIMAASDLTVKHLIEGKHETGMYVEVWTHINYPVTDGSTLLVKAIVWVPKP